jgi:hypothetical protein
MNKNKKEQMGAIFGFGFGFGFLLVKPSGITANLLLTFSVLSPKCPTDTIQSKNKSQDTKG